MKLICCYFLLAACAAAQTETASGRWDLMIVIDKLKVPFSMQLDFTEGAVSGTFTNAQEKVASTKGIFVNDTLRLTFPPDNKLLDAKIIHGALTGKFSSFAVEGAAYCTCASEGEAGPDISGLWTLTTANAPSASLVIERTGDDTIAHLLQPADKQPADKNGALTGRFDGLAFMLHHFDGTRASLLEIEPRPDGSLEVTLREPYAVARKFRATKTPLNP